MREKREEEREQVVRCVQQQTVVQESKRERGRGHKRQRYFWGQDSEDNKIGWLQSLGGSMQVPGGGLGGEWKLLASRRVAQKMREGRVHQPGRHYVLIEFLAAHKPALTPRARVEPLRTASANAGTTVQSLLEPWSLGRCWRRGQNR